VADEKRPTAALLLPSLLRLPQGTPRASVCERLAAGLLMITATMFHTKTQEFNEIL
jgi:hypothetical protein